MQEKILKELVNLSFDAPKKKEPKKKIKELVKQNDALIPQPLPEGVHLPDENELEEMRRYAVKLHKKYPMWSKRKIRNDVQKTFNVKIYK